VRIADHNGNDHDDDHPILPRFLEETSYDLIVPGDYSAMLFSDWYDKTDERLGDCRVREDASVDAALNNDHICQQATSPFHVACHVFKTEADEYLVYTFQKDPYKHLVNFSFRLASKRDGRRIKAVVYSEEGEEVASKIVSVPSEGRNHYRSKSWSNVDLGRGEYYALKIVFLDSKVRKSRNIWKLILACNRDFSIIKCSCLMLSLYPILFSRYTSVL
jgi:hypothetical protein